MTAVSRLVLCCGLLLVGPSVAQARDRLLWSRRVGPTGGSVALAVDSGVVVTVTWVGDVVALDAVNGRVRWRVAAPPASHRLAWDTWIGVAGGVAVVGRADSRGLSGFDVATGRRRFQIDLEGPPTSLAACPGTRLVAATHRTSAATPGTFVATAVDPATGAVLWEVPVAGDIRAAGDGVLLVSERSGLGRLPGALHAVRCDDGRAQVVRTGGLRFPVVVDADGSRAVVVDHNDSGAVLASVDGGPPRTLFGVPHVPGRRLGALRGDRLYLVSSDPDIGAAVSIANLSSGAIEAQSAPRTVSADMLLVGSQLVTSYGGSGTRDVVHVLDADDLRPLATVFTTHAAMGLVADEHRVYATLYDGSVIAIPLPRPAPPPAALRVVTPRRTASPRASPVASFLVEPERVIDAHPPRARTSGQRTAGTVSALTFVGGGRLLATGGNDDRVRIFRPTDGVQTWASPPLGRDVTLVAAGASRLAARVYGGRTFVWEVDDQGRGHEIARLGLPHGWSLAMTPSGARVAADELGGGVMVVAIPSRTELAAIASAGTSDARALVPRGRWVVRRVAADRLGIIDLDGPDSPVVAGTVPYPASPEGAGFVQGFARGPSEVVVEWCAQSWCEVQLLEADGRVRARARFDTTGAQWVPHVPSTIQVSPDGTWLFFHRNGLAPFFVRLTTGERVALAVDETTNWASPSAAFSPIDPTLVALSTAPAAHQVTLFRIRETHGQR